jgi:hypothetical protein
MVAAIGLSVMGVSVGFGNGIESVILRFLRPGRGTRGLRKATTIVDDGVGMALQVKGDEKVYLALLRDTLLMIKVS